MRLRPRPGWATDFNFEYDVNFNQPRSLGASTTLGGEHASLQASWTRIQQLDEDPAKREVISSMVRGGARLAALPGGFSLEGSVDYDFARKELYHANAKLHWDVQCCGFVTEVIRTNWGGYSDWQWRFSLNLANVGSAGSFMGVDAQQRQGGLGGQR